MGKILYKWIENVNFLWFSSSSNFHQLFYFHSAINNKRKLIVNLFLSFLINFYEFPGFSDWKFSMTQQIVNIRMYVYPLPSFYYNSWRIKNRKLFPSFFSSYFFFLHFVDVSIWIFAEMVDPFYNTAGTFDYISPERV